MSNKLSLGPVVIEAAITPFRYGAPVFDADGMIREALQCLDAGAGIVHHHHDFGADEAAAIAEMVSVGRAIVEAYPQAILYPDFLQADALRGKIAHFEPLLRAGLLGMMPIDPGAGVSGQLDAGDLPTGSNPVRFTFDDSNQIARAARAAQVPLSIGVFEPVQLRYALAYHAAGKLPKGSMVKLYFGGRYSLIKPGARAMNFGLPPTRESVEAYLRMLEGTDIAWCVSVVGDALMDSPIARYALERGGHLRVGTEDTAGQTRDSNRQTVERAVELAARVGRPVVQGGAARAALNNQAPPRFD